MLLHSEYLGRHIAHLIFNYSLIFIELLYLSFHAQQKHLMHHQQSYLDVAQCYAADIKFPLYY